MLKVSTVRGEPEVHLGAVQPVLSPEVSRRVENIWQAETALQGNRLFNGRLFSIAQSTPERMHGWLAEYRWFIAQRRDPSLRAFLNVRPLAVTGVLHCADGIVFGRRANHLEMDPGCWELVPSGGVDGSHLNVAGRVDLAAQLLTELVEETGIPSSEVASPPHAFAMVEDARSHVTDIGFAIRIAHSAAQMRARFAKAPHREYVALEVVPATQIAQFLDECGDTLVAVSRALLGRLAF
jgi:hypothetical protein